MPFREIEDQFYKQAGYAIDASRGGDYFEYDHAELVAASAAIALERGAPRLIASSYDTPAESYLEQGSQAWRRLHSGVARFIETDANESKSIWSAGKGVDMVVGDVLQQVSARKIAMAAENRDFEPWLNEAQLEMARAARVDERLRKDIGLISTGSYSALSDGISDQLDRALKEPLTGSIGLHASRGRTAVDAIADRSEELLERVSSAEGGFAFMFTPVSKESMDKVVAFHRDHVPTGNPAIDRTMEMLSGTGRTGWPSDIEEPIMIAQARLIEDRAYHVASMPSDMAVMALTDAAIMREARAELDPDHDTDLKARGRYDLLPEDMAEKVGRMIVFGQRTLPTDRIRMELEMMDRADGMERIRPELADEVARTAGRLVDANRDDHSPEMVDMSHRLSDHYHGRRDDRALVDAAQHLGKQMWREGRTDSAEWLHMRNAVDAATGAIDEDAFGKPTKAAQMAGFAAAAQLGR